MKQQFYDAIVDGPIIAAVKDETGVEVCIQNDIRVVFILYGELITIPDIVQRLKDAGKFVIVHLDLIRGACGQGGSGAFYTVWDGGGRYYFHKAGNDPLCEGAGSLYGISHICD